MYIGRYYHKVDEKHRVSLPTKFRDLLTEGSIITRGLDGCLNIYDQKTWNERIASVTALSQTKKAHRDYIRYLTNDAQEVDVDAQGRILLSSDLLTQGHIQKDVCIVGSFDHIEIWDMETYHRYMDTTAANIEETIEHIEDHPLQTT